MDDGTLARQQAQRRGVQDLQNSKYASFLQAGVVNPERRERAENDFKFFCQSYFPSEFNLEWAEFHNESADKMQQSAIEGSHFAFCLPRGSGKSTLSTACVIWSVLSGHCEFTVYVSATAGASTSRLSAIKTMLRFNDLLMEDYPEIIAPIRFTDGESRKASGQRFAGETTEIEFSSNQIIFATLAGADEVYPWMKKYKKAFGSVLSFASIEGNIRGRSHAKTDGQILRPDFIVIDDPQSRASAASPAQVKKRLDIILGDLSYLGSADRQCGMICPTTTIYENDLSTMLVDHDICPQFKGVCRGVLNKLPFEVDDEQQAERLESLWLVEYDELRRYDLLNGTTKGNDFYLANQEEMDSESVSTWPVRFGLTEVSAIQSSMNSYLVDQQAFFCELQNRPIPLSLSNKVPLSVEDIVDKGLNISRGVTLSDSDVLTAFVDVSQKVLWYCVTCFNKSTYRSHVVEYGTFPKQSRPYVTLATLKKSMQDVWPDLDNGAALTRSLDELTTYLLAKQWKSESGRSVDIDVIGIDSGWSSQVVYDFCKRSSNRKFLLPTKGVGITPTRQPLVNPEKKREAYASLEGQWKYAKNTMGINMLLYDANLWKTRTDGAMRLPKESSGAMTIFNAKENGRSPNHLSFAEQITAETGMILEGNGRSVEVWSCPPHKDEHWGDALVGCFMLAHHKGCVLPHNQSVGSAAAPKKRRRRRFTAE